MRFFLISCLIVSEDNIVKDGGMFGIPFETFPREQDCLDLVHSKITLLNGCVIKIISIYEVDVKDYLDFFKE